MTTMALENRKVLVLNTNWVAVAVASLERAITLLFSRHDEYVRMVDGTLKPHRLAGQPKAKIVDTALDFQQFTWEDWSKLVPKEGEDCIHGTRMSFKVPEVVVLTDYDEMPIQRVHFSRRTIYRRDNFTCQYCGLKVGNEGTIDHIKPKSQGGGTTWENCVLACVQCNSQKANRLPQNAYKGRSEIDLNWRGPSPMKLLSVPKKPKYTLLKGDRHKVPKSWKAFLSEAYWSVELENDNSNY